MRILILILLLPTLTLAQEYELQSQPKVRVDGKEKSMARKSRPSEQVADEGKNDKPKDPLTWAGQVGYSIRTDLADQIEPRLYQHSLSLSYGFQHAPTKLSLTGILGAGYESAGEQNSEVLLNENDTELFVNDFSLAGQKAMEGPWKTNMSLTLSNSFPTSPEAKREGYGSVTTLDFMWSVPVVPKKLSLSAASSVHYIWNRYEYSPATGDLNKQGGWRGILSARWTIWEGWSVGGSIGSQLSRYLDGTNDVTYRNSISTGYSWKRFSVTLATSNGTYLDKEDAYIWFVDEYRRTLSLGASLTF